MLLVDPSLRFRVFADGVEVEALDGLGEALLGHAALEAWRAEAGRGRGPPIATLRGFLAAFDAGAADEATLAGALGFDAHRLAASPSPQEGVSWRCQAARAAGDCGPPLGVVLFAATLLRRDAAGAWHRSSLSFEDAALAAAAMRPRRHAARCAPAAASNRAVPPSAAEPPCDDFPRGGYAAVVAGALPRLAGDGLVSLTLSQSFRRRLGERSPAQAFAALRAVNPAPATFMVDTGEGECVFGASPDLQLAVNGREVECLPVCGTVARGHGPVGEAEALRQLFDEEVDAASLAVCSDALRNDLAPLCEPGSLRLLDRRRPMTLATVVHAVDRLRGRLRDGVDAWDAIVATAAPVMVTGTPRAAALAAIAACEAGARRWYGGLVLEVRAGGAARVGTILRAAAVRDGVVEVRTGGDLLADSDPAREELESRIKAVSLWRALGLPVDPDLQESVAGAAPMQVAAAGPLPTAVALRDGGDPFAAAVADTLRGLGLTIGADAPVAVLVGGDDAFARAAAGAGAGVVALGDAAARVLGESGLAVRAIAPQHGRLVRCLPVAGAPAAATRAFVAIRYSTLALDADADAGAAGWSTWLRDEQGSPLVLARARDRTVCFLIRPESLLSDGLARELLREAISFASAAGS
ncbi:MAG: chorismate-binding protein [Caldimonas sp.]